MEDNVHKTTVAESQQATYNARNIELADAISKYCKRKNEKRDRNDLETVRGWAMEIVLNCDAELNF